MITKLSSYEAEAEILGEIRTVKVHEDCILIEGINGIGEAGRILDALAKGGITAVVHAHGAPLPGGAKPETKPGADVGDGNPTPGDTPVSPSGSPSPGSPSTQPPEHPKTEPPKDKSDGVPDEIKKAGKLKDVIAWLMDKGFKTDKAVLSELKRLAPQIPTVARISASDLEERVGRTMARLAADE